MKRFFLQLSAPIAESTDVSEPSSEGNAKMGLLQGVTNLYKSCTAQVGRKCLTLSKQAIQMNDSLFHTELLQYFCLLTGKNMPSDESALNNLVKEVNTASSSFLRDGGEDDIRFSKTQRSADEIKGSGGPQVQVLAREVERKIRRLVEAGFPIETIENWLQNAVKLSRIRITANYRIILTDYDKEIVMRQLPKTLFLFFLKHPEGCRLKELVDHRDELLAIYRKLTNLDDQVQMESSIDSLVDPLSNSFSEKCAAVKSAFLEELPERVANHYYIQGPQGGVKGISLDRTLVEWESEK